jgi:hypothetical protein
LYSWLLHLFETVGGLSVEAGAVPARTDVRVNIGAVALSPTGTARRVDAMDDQGRVTS